MTALVRLRVPLGFVAAAAYLWLARPTPGAVALGLPLVLAGEAVRLWASGHIRKNRELTTAGPYALVRHPLYLGSLLLVLGFAIASGSLPVGGALVLLFALVYLAVARREEARLEENYGAEYRRWREAVPAFLPRLRRWREAEAQGFSWKGVERHRELRAVLGAALLLAILAVRARLAVAP